jgi:hypoxanthine phosphoribosyltransferase
LTGPLPALPVGARPVAGPPEVAAAWDRLAGAIQPHVEAPGTVLLGVLMGGVVALVEIARRLRGDFVMDYCHLTRYAGARSGGEIRWIERPHEPLAGRTVVIVDDICDEGDTLQALRDHCAAEGAARVLVAVLVKKEHRRRQAALLPDFVGLHVDDRYVFGCGMDLDRHWRHLPGIYAINE